MACVRQRNNGVFYKSKIENYKSAWAVPEVRLLWRDQRSYGNSKKIIMEEWVVALYRKQLLYAFIWDLICWNWFGIPKDIKWNSSPSAYRWSWFIRSRTGKGEVSNDLCTICGVWWYCTGLTSCIINDSANRCPLTFVFTTGISRFCLLNNDVLKLLHGLDRLKLENILHNIHYIAAHTVSPPCLQGEIIWTTWKQMSSTS